MSDVFTDIDLSALPAPELFPVDYDAALEARLSAFTAEHPELADTLALESDPIRKLLEEIAYLQVLAASQANHAQRQGMLAFASGAALDQLAAIVPLARKPGEADEAFRARIQLAPEALSVAGPRGAYRFIAMERVEGLVDVEVYTRTNDPAVPPGEVHLYVLTEDESDVALATGKRDEVLLRLDDDVVPDTDLVRVKLPEFTPYNILAGLDLKDGVSQAAVVAAAQAAAEALALEAYRIGGGLSRAQILGALVVEGVTNVELFEPPADIAPAPRTVPLVGNVFVFRTGDPT